MKTARLRTFVLAKVNTIIVLLLNLMHVKTFVNPGYHFDSIKTAGSNYVKKASSTFSSAYLFHSPTTYTHKRTTVLLAWSSSIRDLRDKSADLET